MQKLRMREANFPGRLITFCGLDGCGKTTMMQRLTEELQRQQMDIFLTKQPTSFVRNSDIFRTYMDCPDHSAYDYRSLSLLAASDRLQHGSKVIEPELARGRIVLSDRYFYSCLANLHARGFEEDRWIYEIAVSVVKPDIAFFFDVPVDTAVARVRSRDAEKDRYIDMELQYKLRDQYIEICRANGGVLISTEQSPEDTYRQVLSEVKKLWRPNVNISERVADLLQKLSGCENIRADASLQNDLGMDSLAMVTLLIQLEDTFQIELKETDMNPLDLNTVSDIVELITPYVEGDYEKVD